MENACATLGTEGQVVLNSSPCKEDFECTTQSIMAWYNTDPITRTNVLPCTAAKELVIGANWACTNREASKNLIEGTYPKTCLSSADCQLVDGTFNECVCTPRTTGTSGYCRPNISSSYFQNYWDLCTLGNNFIKDKYEGFYWFLKTNYAVYYDTEDLPTCIANLWEFAMYRDMEQEIQDNAGALFAVVWLLFA